jgi:enoyl-CoA hydratase/carnithine racemase
MAGEIAELAPLALKLLKRYVTEEILPKGPTEYFGRAKRAMGVTENSEDFQEGIRAYKEKRKPVFHGR